MQLYYWPSERLGVKNEDWSARLIRIAAKRGEGVETDDRNVSEALRFEIAPTAQQPEKAIHRIQKTKGRKTKTSENETHPLIAQQVLTKSFRALAGLCLS